MSLDHLVQVLLPPSDRLTAASMDEWTSIERTIGAVLPSDYKDFIANYGAGCIDGFLWVLSPFAKNENLNLVSRSKVILAALRQLRDDYRQQLPFPLFPEDDGVFPWGITENGDELYWRFKGGKLQQSVIVSETRGAERQEFDLSMTGFLADVVSRRISVRFFPKDFPSDTVRWSSAR